MLPSECDIPVLSFHLHQSMNTLHSLRKWMAPMPSNWPPVFKMQPASCSAQDMKENGDHWSTCVYFIGFQIPGASPRCDIPIVTLVQAVCTNIHTWMASWLFYMPWPWLFFLHSFIFYLTLMSGRNKTMQICTSPKCIFAVLRNPTVTIKYRTIYCFLLALLSIG